MRGDREYLEFTIERALRGGKVALCTDELALRLARSTRGVLKALTHRRRHARRALHMASLDIAGRLLASGCGALIPLILLNYA